MVVVWHQLFSQYKKPGESVENLDGDHIDSNGCPDGEGTKGEAEARICFV